MEQVKFIYITDYYAINSQQLNGYCGHMICLEGEGSFVFNEKNFHFCAGDILILTQPHKLENLAGVKELRVEFFATQYNFLYKQLPSNSFAIGGSISLNTNPIIHATKEEGEQFLNDLRVINKRMQEKDKHRFYMEMMASLCCTMMYDLFSFHAHQNELLQSTDRQSYVIKELLNMLSAGQSRTQRSVEYYAKQLNITPKYLSKTVKRTTGFSVSTFINRYTIPIIKDYLNNEKLSLSQIADVMNFNSLSYFSRYCTKHLGVTPSEYRKSLQPSKQPFDL